MKVLLLTNSIGFGGVEKNVAFLANNLTARGHEVCVLNYNSIGDYINNLQQIFHDQVHLLNYDRKNEGKLNRLYKIIYTYRQTRLFSPDVIVGFTAFPSYVAKIVSVLTGVPSVMTERGNPYVTINKKHLPSLIELCVINQSAGGVFQIEGAAKFFSKGLQSRACIIPNPISLKNVPNIKPFAEREKSIVSVGRLHNFQKRYDIMFKAFARFLKTHPDWILKLYGDGAANDKQEIFQYCVEEGIVDNVRFLGVSNAPTEDIVSDGIFVITSDFEGISNSLLEAMAVGLPCVSTDCDPGGARMLITDRVNGRIVPKGDYNAIADALNEYVENQDLADLCGNKARLVTSSFDSELIVNKWESYLFKIIGK